MAEEPETEEEQVDSNLSMEHSIDDGNSLSAEEPVEEEIYEIFAVSDLPKFDGGSIEENFSKFFIEAIDYPNKAMEEEKQGTVVVQFILTKTGELDYIKVISDAIGYGLEEEAIRVVTLSAGRWIPAQNYGKPVSVKLRLPVKFALY
jgi:protein TonB